jgi:outer membrane protein assembly factor BamB
MPFASFVLLCGMLAGASPADTTDWPHWRGPNRDGTVAASSGWDTGAWPPGEPIWKASVGVGSSSPVVVDRRVYVMGWADDHDTLRCLAADSGKVLWQTRYAAARYGRHATGDEGLYSGIIATPEVDPSTGLLYTLGVDGHLACWRLADGRPQWNLNLYDDYGAGQRAKIGRSGRRDYGYTTSPLVYGDWLIVEVGAERGTLVGFDKRTGREVWTSRANHQAGHTGSPVLMTVDAIPCVAVLALKTLLVVRLDAGHLGETMTEYAWETEFAQNIATPVVWKNRIIITSGYNHQTICMLDISRQGARKVWEQPQHSKVCSPIVHAGCIYWVHETPVCLDLETGRTLWEGPRRFGDAGSGIITADQRWILWTGRGDLVLAETAARSPGEFRELARSARLFRTEVWPHVVLAEGRIYCKDRDGNMACFAIDASEAKKPQAASQPKPPAAQQPPDSQTHVQTWPGTAPGQVSAR